MVGENIERDLAYFTECQLEEHVRIKKLKSTTKTALKVHKELCDEMVKSCAFHRVKTNKSHPLLVKFIKNIKVPRKKPIKKVESIIEATTPVETETKVEVIAPIEIKTMKIDGICPVCISKHVEQIVNVIDDNNVECFSCKTAIAFDNGRILV